MATQKTWRGKTGGGWVRTATAGLSKAGCPAVWIKVAGENMQIDLTESGDAAVASISGLEAVIDLSATAQRRLAALSAQADRLVSGERGV
jgi:hypothetical protein